eukprot:3610498-Rhodomonas_salina.1
MAAFKFATNDPASKSFFLALAFLALAFIAAAPVADKSALIVMREDCLALDPSGRSNNSGDACDLFLNADTSLITDMSSMFWASSFTGDISKWDVSAVNKMFGMFAGSEFTGDISKWDVSA